MYTSLDSIYFFVTIWSF